MGESILEAGDMSTLSFHATKKFTIRSRVEL